MDSNVEPSADAAAPQAQGDSKSIMPILLGVGAVAAVVALVLMWPGGEKAGRPDGSKASASADAKGSNQGGGRGAAGGGVAARENDDPNAQPAAVRRNPAVRLPNVGLAPEAPTPSNEPPTFANKAEEIAWYEKKLEQAKKSRDARQTFVDRLPRVRERLEQGPDAARQLQAFEGRKKIVEDNYARAVADVNELEHKLAELRGG